MNHFGSGASQCYSKKRYSDEKYATKLANKIGWERKVKLRAYACTLCGGYHLTSKEFKEKTDDTSNKNVVW